MRLVSVVTMTLAATLAVAAAVPASAQSPATSPAAPAASVPVGPAITVVATDYHFGGLPTTVPVGTSLTLDNQGAELHEMVLFRKNDGVTKTFEELLQMPGDEPLAYVTQIGEVFAVQGSIADGSIVVAQEGEYIALCFIPQGMTALPDPSASPDPALASATPHFMLGMAQTFTVTAAGTPVGPLPSTAPMASAAPSTAP